MHQKLIPIMKAEKVRSGLSMCVLNGKWHHLIIFSFFINWRWSSTGCRKRLSIIFLLCRMTNSREKNWKSREFRNFIIVNNEIKNETKLIEYKKISKMIWHISLLVHLIFFLSRDAEKFSNKFKVKLTFINGILLQTIDSTKMIWHQYLTLTEWTWLHDFLYACLSFMWFYDMINWISSLYGCKICRKIFAQ